MLSEDIAESPPDDISLSSASASAHNVNGLHHIHQTLVCCYFVNGIIVGMCSLKLVVRSVILSQ